MSSILTPLFRRSVMSSSSSLIGRSSTMNMWRNDVVSRMECKIRADERIGESDDVGVGDRSELSDFFPRFG